MPGCSCTGKLVVMLTAFIYRLQDIRVIFILLFPVKARNCNVLLEYDYISYQQRGSRCLVVAANSMNVRIFNSVLMYEVCGVVLM